MTSKVVLRNSPIVDVEELSSVVDRRQTSEIANELDTIIGKSRRRSRLRHALRSIGGAFARWLDDLVPPAAAGRSLELPPPIRFPFF